MSGRILIRAIELFVASMCFASAASAGDYRGAAAGWPTYSNGTYAAGYPTNYAADPYYVARPIATTTSAGYGTASSAGYAPTATMYMPATAAYANPTYFAAYGRSPALYRPVSVGYAPTAGGYYAQTAAYAPVTANYAPANSYAVTPAGVMAGSEAAAYLGQPYPLNYVPPRVTYRPSYAAVPVYMYRPVTAYQPVPYQPGAVQPVTCMQASTCSTCMPQPRRCGSCFSWLNPFTWFHRSSCCGYAPPTTAYCGTGCGQPYYPTAPIVPVIPTVPVVPPTNIIPAQPQTYIPRAGTTIPPPPTVAPGTRLPADFAPSLAPRGGATIQPSPGGSFGPPIPGGSTPLPMQPGFQQPGFQQPGFQQPGFQQPGGSQIVPSQPPIGGGQGSFPSGTNYPPPSDPYNSLTPANPGNGAGGSNTSPPPNSGSMQSGPNHSVFGSGYRGSPMDSSSSASDGVIRAPELQPALPRGVQSVPDLDAQQPPRPLNSVPGNLNSVPGNSAPKLLDPRDKTAGRDPRWAVVPALWPTKAAPSKMQAPASAAAAGQLSARPVTPTKAYQAAAPLSASPYVASQASAADYDDRGWKTAAF